MDMAAAVRKKGKSLDGCIAALLKWSFGNQHPVDKEILKAAGVTAGRCTLGIPEWRRTPDHHRILSGKVGGQHEKKSD